MNNQRILSALLVEELRKQGALEDVICEYGIESLRECTYCHRLMNQGWIYRGFETFCSDKCLMNAHPIFNPIKTFIYNYPEVKTQNGKIELDLGDACIILSFPLRDMYLKEHPELK